MIEFESYWRDVRDEHMQCRRHGGAEWEILPRGDLVEARAKKWRVDWIRYSSVKDTVISGWVARPDDHDSTGVGLLWLPGYSYGNPSPDETNLVRGATTLCINVHGNPPDSPYINPAGKRDYITSGIDDAELYIYRTIVLHCLLAMDVIGELEGVDADNTVVAGMSQGGALAMITAANHPAPKICFADMPFLCSVREALTISHSPAYKAVARAMEERPDRAEQILQTICLFDGLYHAPRLTTPISLTAGGKDPASRYPTIERVYEAAASKIKSYRLFPSDGHVFLPDMVQIYADWIDRLILGHIRFNPA